MVVQPCLARRNKVRRLVLLIHHEASRGQHELCDEKHLNCDARKHVLYWRLKEALYDPHEQGAEDEHKYSSIKRFENFVCQQAYISMVSYSSIVDMAEHDSSSDLIVINGSQNRGSSPAIVTGLQARWRGSIPDWKFSPLPPLQWDFFTMGKEVGVWSWSLTLI